MICNKLYSGKNRFFHFISFRQLSLIFAACVYVANIFSQNVTVWTQRYDNKRLGWNNREIVLNTSNVNVQSFGLLFTRPVDDQIYAQPLIVSNLLINGVRQNVVFVATVNNTVYAFNADNITANAPLWSRNYTPPGTRVPRATDMNPGYLDFSGNIGIVGTPVIDTISSTMYFVSRDMILNTGVFEQYLHAINITTGAERSGSPVLVTATYPGRGDGSVGGIIRYEPKRQNQRPGLLLHNGVIYIASASHGDFGPYHGWIIGYDATTLQRRYSYNTTPDGNNGGIWMSGLGPVVDDNGYIYVTTGNGTTGSPTNPNYFRNRGESMIKLIPSGDTMRVVNFFTPANYAFLNSMDLDYGVDGPLIIPNTTISLSGTKEGKLYVVSTNNMGKYSPRNDSVRQILYASKQGLSVIHVHGTAAYYRYSAQVDSEFVYVWAESDSLAQFPFIRSRLFFDTLRMKKGNIKLDNGMPGGILSVSSNSTILGTGIVWASHPLSGNANHMTRPGKLQAFDARNVKRLLWSSTMNNARDSVGSLAKFNTPIVANGKVYLATFSNRLNVYGLLNQSGNPNPIAVITANPISGNLPLSVSFSSAGSNDPDGQPISFSWNFGDGTTGSGATVNHIYTAAGTYTAVLTVSDANGSGTASRLITVTTPGTGLPLPWVNSDVGNTVLAGSATFASGTFAVRGSGADIWSTADAFQFVYQPLTGNGNIVARVASQPGTDSWSKAGVMIRESLTTGAREASTLVTPLNGLAFQYRTTANGYTGRTAQASIVAPYWVRIERNGNIFRSFSSPNGITWTKIDSIVIAMPNNTLIGLCVTSHNTALLTTVNFDNVTVNGMVAPNPNPIAVITANPISGNLPLSVSFSSAGSNDPDGQPISFSWNFGDGTTGSGATVNHTYTVAGAYTAVLTVSDANGSGTASRLITVTTPGTGLPSPWVNSDVGNTVLAGSTTFTSGTFAVRGSGADIWSTADAFQFVYQPLTGNGNIVAMVASQPGTDSWSKAGVMIRESLTAGAREASALVTPLNGLAFQYRTTANGYTGRTAQASIVAPYWVRIERNGNIFRSFSSPNGITWTKIDSIVIAMPNNTLIGLCVTSHNTALLTTVNFDNVTVNGTVAPNPNPIAVITANPISGNLPLSVSFSSAGSNDPDGQPISFSWNFGDGTTGSGATVNHTYTAAGAYTAVLTVSDANGSGTASRVITVTTPGTGLPSPWVNSDVGNTVLAGSTTFTSGTFAVRGSGADIWSTADAFQFVYQPLTGNGNIVARVASQPGTDSWSKAGVMIRESLTAGAREASTLVTPLNGLAFQYRTTANGYTGRTAQASIVAPYWVRIERNGNIFRSFSSPNGITWTKIDSIVIAMPDNTLIGLCVTSHNTALLTSVSFDNVTVTRTLSVFSHITEFNSGSPSEPDSTNLTNIEISKMQIEIFPNPFKNHITVRFSKSGLWQVMKILDLDGRVISQWRVSPEQNELEKDLSSLKNGVYILKLEGFKGIKIVKLLKE